MNTTSIPPLTSWMSFLPDIRSLPSLSIPGTHNSCSIYAGNSLGFAQTQTKPINWQLDMGIRYLDIRCSNVREVGINAPGTFDIYHGSVPQYRSFGEVLDDCFYFLSINKKETIIMRVQQEHSKDSELYKRILLKYLDRYGQKNFYLRNNMPDLESVRGKIVLLTANPYLGSGLFFSRQEVQDDFDNPRVANKKERVVEYLNKSKNSSDSSKLYINHLSATGWKSFFSMMTPWDYATIMNKFTLKKIQGEFSTSYRLGVIVHDYVGSSKGEWNGKDTLIAEAIIARNRFLPPYGI